MMTGKDKRKKMLTRKILMICLFTLYFMLLGLWGNGCSSGRDNPVIPQENQSSETMPAAVNVINDIPVAYSGCIQCPYRY
jgi:hypothetical protein